MRLDKAERAIEAERATVCELQRRLAAAEQVPPAPLRRSPAPPCGSLSRHTRWALLSLRPGAAARPVARCARGCLLIWPLWSLVGTGPAPGALATQGLPKPSHPCRGLSLQMCAQSHPVRSALWLLRLQGGVVPCMRLLLRLSLAQPAAARRSGLAHLQTRTRTPRPPLHTPHTCSGPMQAGSAQGAAGRDEPAKGGGSPAAAAAAEAATAAAQRDAAAAAAALDAQKRLAHGLQARARRARDPLRRLCRGGAAEPGGGRRARSCLPAPPARAAARPARSAACAACQRCHRRLSLPRHRRAGPWAWHLPGLGQPSSRGPRSPGAAG